MKKLLLLLLILPAAAFSQALTKPDAPKFKPQIGFGLTASTNGLGGNLYFRPLKRVSVKLGYEKMNFDYDYTIEESDLTMETNFKYKTGAISLIGSYQIFPGLYVAAGAAKFNFNPEVSSTPTTQVKFGDIYLNPETIGSLKVGITPGNKIAPYAALGFGNAVPYKHGFSFGIEFGAFYMGSPKLNVEASGILAPTQDADHVGALQNELKEFGLYPVVKLNFSFKLFTFNKN